MYSETTSPLGVPSSEIDDSCWSHRSNLTDNQEVKLRELMDTNVYLFQVDLLKEQPKEL